MTEVSLGSGPWFTDPNHRERPEYEGLDPSIAAVIDQLASSGGAVLPNLITATQADTARASLAEYFRFDPNRRLLDGWIRSSPVRSIATERAVLDLLSTVYRRRPIPFQTLNFARGTEQRPHADTVHFDTLPSEFMCGVWVALEDIGPEQGPLRYYPGSCRLRGEQANLLGARPDDFDYSRYEREIASLVEDIDPVDVCLRKGDGFLWTASLVHGGAPITRAGTTRWSQVTHYLFDHCTFITPMESDLERGEYRLRLPLIDVTTGREVSHEINGQRARFAHLANGRSRLLAPGAHHESWAAAIASAARAATRRSKRRVGIRFERRRTASR